MRPLFRNTLTAMTALCLLGTMPAGMTAFAAIPTDTIKGSFTQSTVKDYPNAYGTEVYTYSDAYFRGKSDDYQPRLATASAYLAMASASSSRVDETHGPDRDIRAFLEDIGFTNIETNADYAVTPTTETVAAAVASKQIRDADGKPCTLLAIAPRSSGYGAEWASNFVLGTEGDAAGFAAGKDKVLALLGEYAQKYKLSGNLKVWIAGYSRGGAIANLTAAALIDDPAAVFGTGVNLPPDQIFTYTFEAPLAGDPAKSTRDPKYIRIFNIISRNDLVPRVAPGGYGFDRYGTDHIVEEYSDTTSMRDQLVEINWRLNYTYANLGTAPEDFHKRMLGMALDGSAGTYPEIADDADHLPATQDEFLQMLVNSLVNAVPSRALYTKQVEPYLPELVGMFVPALLDGDDAGAAISANAKQSRWSTPLLVYLYMDYELSRIPIILEDSTADAEKVENFFNKTNRLAMLLRVMTGELSEDETKQMQAFVSNLKPEEQAWLTDVLGDLSPAATAAGKQKTGIDTWNLSEETAAEAAKLYTMYGTFMTADHTEGDKVIYRSYTPEHFAQEQAFVKERLAVCYKNFMQDFLTASGASAETIARQTCDPACASMPAVAEALLLSSPGRTDAYTQDIEDGESCDKLATILGNANNFLYAHAMDGVLAWVRAEDPDYQNYTKPKKSERIGCRRVCIGTDAALHGTVYDAAGTVAAEFSGDTLTRSEIDWIRFQDGRLRLPADQAYTVTLTADEAADFSLTVEEYSALDGAAVCKAGTDAAQDWSKLRLLPGGEYTLTLTAAGASGADWVQNSTAVYTLEQTKVPATTEPVTEATDQPATTAPLPFTNERLCEMAVRDYQTKTGAADVLAAAETGTDGKVTIRLTDAQGQSLAVYTVDPLTGKGLDQAGNVVDLPQTGTTSRIPALAAAMGLALTAAGAWLMHRSGLRRRKD